jgi:hypothetical protein
MNCLSINITTTIIRDSPSSGEDIFCCSLEATTSTGLWTGLLTFNKISHLNEVIFENYKRLLTLLTDMKNL